MAGRDPFQGGVRRHDALSKTILPYSRPSRPKRGFLAVADREQVARHLADAVDVAGLGVVSLGWRPDSGAACDEEVLDDLGHQPPFLGLGRLADDGREVQFLLGQPFQGRFGDRAEPLRAHSSTMRS